MPALSPYRTAAAHGRALPTHVPQHAVDDLQRVRAYETYEDIYHNVSDIFEAVTTTPAGNEVFRRLVPSARTIVEAANRYLCVGMSWVPTAPQPDPIDGAAELDETAMAQQQQLIMDTMTPLLALMKREEIPAKILSLKRWMLIRGDGILHVTADPLKEQGKRLRVVELNPGGCFQIMDPADSERVIGYYLVNVVLDDEEEQIVQRLEYRRMMNQEQASQFGTPLGGIYTRLSFWELDGWDDRTDTGSDELLKPAPVPSRFASDPGTQVLLAGTPMPAQITALPVYHYRNNRSGGASWGTSEIQGIETLIAGINQTVSDEDLAVALYGLGAYWTNAGRAVDKNGQEVPWSITPGVMLELVPGDTGAIHKLEGVGSVQPSRDHVELLKNEARETTGTPAIATGRVDVSVASSGVALRMEMAPVLSKNAEKELEIASKTDQMLYDLINMWFPAYEGIQPNGVTVRVEFDDPLPPNSNEIVTDLTALVTARIMSAATARKILSERLGYQFDEREADLVATEQSALVDQQEARLVEEAGLA